MTTERMLELIILNMFMDRYRDMAPQVRALTEETISISQIDERRYILEREFLAPYVIDNTPKGG